MSSTNLYDKGLEAFKKSVREQRKIKDSKDESVYIEFLAANTSPGDAMRRCNAIKAEADSKYGAIKVSENIEIKASWISNVLDNIQNFISVGNYVMKKAPESVGTIWFGISLGLGAIQNNYALYSLFGSGLQTQVEMMVLITHVDKLYDETNKPGFTKSELLQALFDDITQIYALMLDFSFSIKRHVSGGGMAKLKHAFKDFFAAEGKKYQGKVDAMLAMKQKILEESQGVFQAKTTQRLEGVQDSVNAIMSSVEDIKAFESTSREFFEASIAGQQALMEKLNEVIATTKPRTPWDYAMLEFRRVSEMLNPLKNIYRPLIERLDQRLNGTGEWIFSLAEYERWLQSSKGDLLSVTGSNGVGTSFILANVWARLGEQLNGETHVILYLTCDMVGGGEGRDETESAQSLNRIGNTLVHQLYELATADEENLDVLTRCNTIFKNPKKRNTTNAAKDKKRNDNLPEFVLALNELATALSKTVFVILDAVDRMGGDDQEELYRSLINTSQLHFLVGCQSTSGSKFFESVSKAGTNIDVEKHNAVDIGLMLDAELELLEQWSVTQRKEAKEQIMRKSGPNFKYVTQVAVPFVREPFRGLLSDRLEALPDGMGETYTQALLGMPASYLGLLKTTLSFALFAPEYVEGIEVMDAFTGIYDRTPTESDLEAVDQEDAAAYTTISDLQFDNLRRAAGPFLDIEKDEDDGTPMITLKDAAQVRGYCFRARNQESDGHGEHAEWCARCKESVHSAEALSFSEKEGHLDLAIICIRHMCNPLFQKRFMRTSETQASASGGNGDHAEVRQIENEETDASKIGGSAEDSEDGEDEESEDVDEEENEDGDEEENEDGDEEENEDGREEESEAEDGSTESSGEEGDAGDDSVVEKMNGLSIQNDGPDGNAGDATTVDHNKQNTASEPVPATDGYDSDDSLDDEDRGQLSFLNGSIQLFNPAVVDDDDENSDSDSDDDDGNDFSDRYELLLWDTHILEAQKLWNDEEMRQHPKWMELYEELDRFAFQNEEAFASYQEVLDIWNDDFEAGAAPPLLVAAYCGLTSWTTHLLDSGGDIAQRSSDEYTPLAAAALEADNLEMLELLLKRGADPNEQTENRLPAFHSWMWTDSSVQSIKLFLKYGADCTMVDKFRGQSLLHYVAYSAKDADGLHLLMGQQNPEKRPNINAVDNDRETPLHLLLQRRDVSVELLNAFLSYGADPNAEDNRSERPLQEASFHGDEQVIRTLLPKVTDINDPDRRGRTALHQAAWNGHKACVQLLLDGGADANVVDRHNRSPFFFACLGTSGETVKILLDTLRKQTYSVFDILMSTKRHRTPLRQVAAHGFTDTVKELLALIQSDAGDKRQELINKVDTRKGRTALHCAAFRGQTDSVRLLLDYEADATIKDKTGKTALQLSYEQWSLSGLSSLEQIISILIEKDPQAAVKDAELLSVAAVNGSKLILEKLHHFDADLKSADRYGWTPIMLAQQFDRTEAEKFLIRQNAWSGILPSRWIDVPAAVSADDAGLLLNAPSVSGRYCMTTDVPLPSGLPTFYFEATILSSPVKYPEVAVGFSTAPGSAIDFPGWVPVQHAPSARSWGFHGDDGGFGKWTGDYKKNLDFRYGPGDTAGVGVDIKSGTMWATLNGVKVAQSADFYGRVRGRLFPLLGINKAIVKVQTNLKGPFKWKSDIEMDDGSNGDSTMSNGIERRPEAQAGSGAER